MNQYLKSTDIIDWKTPQVRAKANEIAQDLDSPEEIARRCFEYVRDEIKHSWDFKLNPITCSASEVLEHGMGYCYAKSHLLAAGDCLLPWHLPTTLPLPSATPLIVNKLSGYLLGRNYR